MKKILTPNDLEPIARLKNGTLRVLLGAYKILSKPKRWSKGSWAKDRHGENDFYANDSACSFCAWGAVKRASAEMELGTRGAADAYNALEDRLGDEISLPGFNDAPKTTRKDVLTLLAKVIKRESRGRIVLPEVAAA